MIYDFTKLTFKETAALNAIDAVLPRLRQRILALEAVLAYTGAECVPNLNALRTEAYQLAMARELLMVKAE